MQESNKYMKCNHFYSFSKFSARSETEASYAKWYYGICYVILQRRVVSRKIYSRALNFNTTECLHDFVSLLYQVYKI